MLVCEKCGGVHWVELMPDVTQCDGVLHVTTRFSCRKCGTGFDGNSVRYELSATSHGDSVTVPRKTLLKMRDLIDLVLASDKQADMDAVDDD